MPYNLLIFPLIGGYFFITHVYFLKFFNQRIERQRLIFNSALWGIILLIVSFLLASFLEGFYPDLVTKFKNGIQGLGSEYLGTTILSLLIGLISPFIINLFLSEEEFIFDAIVQRGTQLEKLLLKSFKEEKYVCLTLKNGKVYIGIASLPKPGQEYFTLLPFYSGYRNNKHELRIDTQYLDVYDNIDQFNSLTKKDLETIIRKEEIMTSRMHDDQVYGFLNQ